MKKLTDIVEFIETQAALVFTLLLDAHPMKVMSALEHLDVLLVKFKRLLTVVALVLVAACAFKTQAVESESI